MDESLTAPRGLTPTELSELRTILKSSLKITSETDEDDADNLLEYAFDLIDSAENVGHIAEEVSCWFIAIFYYCWLAGWLVDHQSN